MLGCKPSSTRSNKVFTMSEEETPSPLAMFRKIPETVRWWMYSIGATAFAIEGVLDAADMGLLDERIQGVVLGIGALFGFTTAVANTKR